MAKGPVFVISSNKMGEGPEDLGNILIRGMIKNLTKVEPAPETIVFYNSGVELMEMPEFVEGLQQLEEEHGTNILACGTCLDFFNLKEKIDSDKHSNMHEILTTLSNADKVVNI